MMSLRHRWWFLVVVIPAVFGHGDEAGRLANTEQQERANNAEDLSPGQALYAQHCAGCHGTSGDGNGFAAPFLFPKPRNFQLGKYRLIGTENSVPSHRDLEMVLLRGMPGSSMPSWAHLSPEDRALLIAEIYRLTGEGARASFVQSLKDVEGLSDEEIQSPEVQDEIAEVVKERTVSGDIVEIASLPGGAESIARGKQLYRAQNCHSCHGLEGKGDGVLKMIDDEQFPTRPRDLTQGVYKGGDDPISIYRRIYYGMPGTPMPNSKNLKPEEIMDMAHFLLSLSTESARESVVLKREKIVVHHREALPKDSDSNEWRSVSTVQVRLMPLWWRDDHVKSVQVQAMHDGRSLAFRLEWDDLTPDKHAGKVEAFKDAVALGFVQGAEPFLGMGSRAAPIDLWMWDADRGQPGGELEDIHPRVVVDQYPFTEQVPESAEYARKGTKTAAQAKLTLPANAVGNLLARGGQHSTGGSSLAAAGPGSTTFRLLPNQLVGASGWWDKGRWTVLFRRSLNVRGPDDGLRLVPGQTASVSFSVWDGSHRDRNGQKQVSIWQDLVLEPVR